MNRLETDEVSRIPYKYRPLTMWSILGWTILFNIPLIGFFLTIVFSLIRENINRRSLARYWLFLKILFVLIVVAAFLIIYFTGNWEMIVQAIQDFFAQMTPQQ